MDKIKKYYTKKYCEDIRLTKDNMHKAELILTFETIRKYLKSGMKILELGAGTGAYSIQLAKEGYDVTAVEIVKYNLDILKSKIKPKMKINPILGTATDLKRFTDEQFDIVLSLGPMYHLSKKERLKSLKESIRVCKHNGILIFAFISNYICMADYFKKNVKALLNDKIINKNNFHFIDNVFTFVTIPEIEDLFKKVKLQKLDLLSPDGISRLLTDEINKFNKKEFEFWLDYLRKTANNPSLIGYGTHALYVAKK
jgi:ubiquinone/menaquinone biosynthesis C-methylase UbiE